MSNNLDRPLIALRDREWNRPCAECLRRMRHPISRALAWEGRGAARRLIPGPVLGSCKESQLDVNRSLIHAIERRLPLERRTPRPTGAVWYELLLLRICTSVSLKPHFLHRGAELGRRRAPARDFLTNLRRRRTNGPIPIPHRDSGGSSQQCDQRYFTKSWARGTRPNVARDS
jgi:hypothetical protein